MITKLYMPQISKKALDRKTFNQVYDRFLRTVLDLERGTKGRSFLGELFTPTERVMLAKRLSILFLLSDGTSIYKIQHILNVSPSTVARMAKSMDRGGYAGVAKIIRSKKCQDLFWKEMEEALRFGMPSMGKDRWKWFNELYPASSVSKKPYDSS